MKKFFLLFFQDIVDIKLFVNEMLYLAENIAQMPIKSGKNPFAFLKKSDYNDTQTVF